ncbi:MAG: JmjC domain-containing protein, partial [Gemmatimonadaceae bacterium]
MEVAEFLHRYWGRDFVVIPNHGVKHNDLFDWPALNTLLRVSQFAPTGLRLHKNGDAVDATAYLTPDGKVRAPAIRCLLKDGATLNLNSLHLVHEAVGDLTEDLSHHLREYVQANLYASWRTTPGFDVHWDAHDVFVVQIAGRKQWEIFGHTLPAPLKDSASPEPPRPTMPRWTGTLTPGDVVYMPRGCWHLAVSVDEPSLHLTIGVARRTVLDYLRWLVPQ